MGNASRRNTDYILNTGNLESAMNKSKIGSKLSRVSKNKLSQSQTMSL